MKKYLSLAVMFVFFGSAGVSLGGSLEDSTLPNLPTMKEVKEKLPAKAQTTRVYMNIYSGGDNFSINDYNLRVNLNGRKTGDYVDFSGMVENRYLSGHIRRLYDNELALSAEGTYLNIRKWGDDYSVSGSAFFYNEPSQYVNLNIYSNSDSSWLSISAAGMYLNANRYSISGNVDTERYSKKLIASIASIIVAIQLKLDEPEEPAEK